MGHDYEKRILRVLDHIHRNPAGDLSLDALADVAAMSRFHWHRVFHGLTGETLAEAVRRIRLHRAACWLVQTNWPLADIATRAGYPNLQSFTRIFRDGHGIPPAAFRKKGELTSPLTRHSKGETLMFPVEVAVHPARRLFAKPHRGAYFEINCAFEALGAIVAARGLWGDIQGMVGVFYDDPRVVAVEDLRSHAGVMVADDLAVPEGLEDVRLDGGRMAILTFKGHYSGLPAAYDYLYGPWFANSGEILRDAPSFEVYLNSPMETAPENLLTTLHLPLV